ncbi:glycoside hydrolase family 16 protein [uncultured Winogradskyella sp.]|uniref:glycoside hydrolase family 16 protein n=1 Tax=uncultured Winogradskyella sp. TaxID=395353 RepID=UPI00262ACD4D|nr:glycoside hydrolase family 16 protein [uncultured Winogradskyella sp.]
MKHLKKVCLPVLLGLTLIFLSCDTDETQTVTNFNNLVMEDNFSTAGVLDSNLWNFDIGNGAAQGIPGWGNNELQYYTDRTENAVVEDGMLKITARQESFEGLGYTSARIQTKGKFQQKYGRFEARIKLPWGQGLWPAFWMLGDDNNGNEVWPQIGEIDIMENRGQEPTLINGSVHGPGYSGGEAITKAFELENDRFDTGFHIFGIEWGEDYINYYVDDVLYNQITPSDVTGQWVFNDEFYIIMNVAVGGNYVGSPNASTVFPQEMIVDYVRVYSAN